MGTEVYVAGVGMTKFGKSSQALPELMVEAASKAFLDAQVGTIDYILIGVMNVEEFTGESNVAALIADRLGLSGVPSSRVETASSTGSAVFESGFYAAASGYHRNVLIIAGEKMTHLPTAQTTRILAEVIERNERSYGASMPALAAMIAQRYRHENRLSSDRMQGILAKVAIKNHYNGSLNHYAQFRKIINETDYFKSRWVSFPLRTFDCAPITDGAVAVILTADKKLVRVTGLGHATDTLAVRHRDSFTSFKSTRLAALQAYNMAKVNPQDISLAEVHDAFTPFEIIGTEDLGFFPPGEGWKAVEEGLTTIQGRLPINPSGGLKARGHPVGASGLAQIAEVFWQLRGDGEAIRQVQGARIGLTQSIGGLANNNLVTILERTDRYRAIPVYWKSEFNPGNTAPAAIPKDPPSATEGILETFTTLYTTPEGVPSPLTLGFVRTETGARVLARSRVENLEIGWKVKLGKEDELYYIIAAEPENLLGRMKQWADHAWGTVKRKEEGS
ncbi:MAG: thiolase family protein [Deltaproteobacteria bacterium]|jgi:acetyl-CoA C-acetyltransferase|nr:thiolase family protein [Deltaproteobacteria bacterium]